MDIGGTFTDVVAYDEATGTYVAGKAATTPQDLTEGVFAALDQVIESPSEIGFTVHGTTQGLNAFLQRRGEQVLLLATRGAGDIYHIARGNRLRLYDIHYRKPTPLVPRRDIVEIGGRLNFAGEELEPLDEDEVRAAARRVTRGRVRSRRRRVPLQLPQPRARAAGERDSGRGARWDLRLPLAPGRAGVARVRAHLLGGGRCLHRADRASLPQRLEVGDAGPRACGAAARDAVERRHRNRRSRRASGRCRRCSPGRSAGRWAASRLARILDRPNLICIDMGGTSFDVSLVVDGKPDVASETTLEGFPLLMTIVNIHTIGAGGGSLAYSRGRRAARRAARAPAPTRARPATGAAERSRPSPTRTSCSAASTRPPSPAAR